ncbi:perilipin-3-like [Melozone crissalis]|uniref:perilipin-3-like n=1 Tax=Melozone crissalis TaxID=40204 RepID=UPI0023DBD67E|nr:perilipin-3-like [Melozone crissalis]
MEQRGEKSHKDSRRKGASRRCPRTSVEGPALAVLRWGLRVPVPAVAAGSLRERWVLAPSPGGGDGQGRAAGSHSNECNEPGAQQQELPGSPCPEYGAGSTGAAPVVRPGPAGGSVAAPGQPSRPCPLRSRCPRCSPAQRLLREQSPGPHPAFSCLRSSAPRPLDRTTPCLQQSLDSPHELPTGKHHVWQQPGRDTQEHMQVDMDSEESMEVDVEDTAEEMEVDELSSQWVGGTCGKRGTVLMESCDVGDQQQVEEGMEAALGTSSLGVPCIAAAMASAVPHEEEAAQSSLEEEEPEVVKEVANLSLVSSTCEVVSAACASSKESQPCLSSVCDAAEKGVQSVTQAMASCVQRVLATLEPHVAAGSEYTAKGLDKLGEKLPLPPKPVEQILFDTKELLSSSVAEAKEAVSSRVLEVLDVTRDTLQGSNGTATPAVTSLEPAVPQMGVLGAEAALGTAEGDSLPIGNEELAQLAACEEGTAALPLEQQQHRRYFVHLDSLPEDLPLLAQLHSPARIQQLCQDMQGTLIQLQCILKLVEAFQQFKQKLQEEQAKLHQMWLDWIRKYLKESGDDSPAEPEEMEHGALLMACRISQQLQLYCSELVAAVQGLPCSLPDELQQALHAIRKLPVALSGADSFQDCSSVLSQRELAMIQEYMEELLDCLKSNTPLSWLVRPSSPREEEEDHQDQSSQEEAGASGAGHLETSSNPM